MKDDETRFRTFDYDYCETCERGIYEIECWQCGESFLTAQVHLDRDFNFCPYCGRKAI